MRCDCPCVVLCSLPDCAQIHVSRCYLLCCMGSDYLRPAHVTNITRGFYLLQLSSGEAERRQLPTVYVISGFISDRDLRRLYEAADAFVLPSRWYSLLPECTSLRGPPQHVANCLS